MLDTNILIYLLKQDVQILKKLKNIPREDLYISSVVLAEMMYGAYKSHHIQHNLHNLSKVASLLNTLPFDDEAAKVYGKIRTGLEKKGMIIGANDLLIAAHALSEKATLVTNNEREFKRIGGLKVKNWVSKKARS